MRRRAFPGSARAVRATVASGGGGVADGASATFTGTGFGTNSVSTEFLGGLNGPIDSGSLGSDFSKASWALAGNYMPRYDNTYTLCRSKALGFDSAYHKVANPSNSSSFGMALDLGSGFSEVFVSGYVRYGCNTSPNLVELQRKWLRLMPIVDVSDNTTQVYTAKWRHASGGSYVENTGHFMYPANDHVAYFNDFPDPSNYPDTFPAENTGEWYHWEFWYQPATGTSTGDGQWTLILRKVSDGTVVMNNHDVTVNDYSSATRYRYLVMQNYHGNSSPQPGSPGTANGTTTFEEPGDGWAFWDDLAVQWGTGARKRVLLGNASTYAACTKFAYQPWTSWSNTSITVTVNKGPFSSLSGLYYYVIDGTGSVINASGIPA